MKQTMSEQALQIEEYKKKISSMESNKTYVDKLLQDAQSELKQAHELLTALGTPTESNHEDRYARTAFNLTTRIALFLNK